MAAAGKGGRVKVMSAGPAALGLLQRRMPSTTHRLPHLVHLGGA
eukprot:COSAG02_NODE_47644_length_339_cov_7.770833_1_plen_43_part_10